MKVYYQDAIAYFIETEGGVYRMDHDEVVKCDTIPSSAVVISGEYRQMVIHFFERRVRGD